MASEPLDRLRALLADRRNDIRSFAVARGGRIVFQQHRPDIPPHSSQPINSMTKSVIGILVGAALQDGAIANLQVPISEYLPEVHGEGVAAGVAPSPCTTC